MHEADALTGRAAAASFKHVSPAGAAVAGAVDPVAAALWRVGGVAEDSLLSAYVRARDADPKSSFGDVVALSRSVDLETARFLRTVISDAVIAPDFERGAVAEMRTKRSGRFLILQADPTVKPPARERREVLGVTIEQDRDDADLDATLPRDGTLSVEGRRDALTAMVALRFTQSNSVAFVRDGATLGIGAGQQNRVDCVRLAGAKTQVWWLRRHHFVEELPMVDGMPRQDRLNWQIRFAGREMTRGQLTEFAELFGPTACERYDDVEWRRTWLGDLTNVTMASDGYLPFRDNVDHAGEYGVTTIVEPGGSARTPEIATAAAELGILHIQTGIRLFHH